MSAAARHLHVVDADTGEVLTDGCPGCAVKDDIIKGHESTIRSWEVKYMNLARDKEAEARADALWPTAREIVKVWRELCNHPKAAFGAAEFDLMRLVLRGKAYGDTLEDRKAVCLRAIAGAAYDPGTRRLRNGRLHRYDELELIFRNTGKVRDFCQRAPANWREVVGLDKPQPAEGVT